VLINIKVKTSKQIGIKYDQQEAAKKCTPIAFDLQGKLELSMGMLEGWVNKRMS
jgi:hypothetical protein